MVTIFFGWGIPVWSQYKDLRPNVDGSTEGKTKGGSAHEGFPEVDPDYRLPRTIQYHPSIICLTPLYETPDTSKGPWDGTLPTH